MRALKTTPLKDCRTGILVLVASTLAAPLLVMLCVFAASPPPAPATPNAVAVHASLR